MPPEIPSGVERQYVASLQRSKQAQHDATPAGETGVPETVRDVLSSPGRSLDGAIQRAMEERMGDSFGDVRIHTDAQAAQACEEINARAFTVGNHIAFNDGEYDPTSPEGQHILAHELAHVRQQTGGAISMMPKPDANLQIDPDPQLEREADEAAKQALSGEEPLVVNRMGADIHIQRMPEAEQLEQARQEASERFDTSVSADPEALAEEVQKLKENQDKLFEAVNGDISWKERLGKATGKGAIGTAGGLVGAAVGTMVAPGVGTAGGAVAGQQLFAELTSGIASDVSKAAYDPVFEAGADAIAQQSGDFSTYIETLIDEKIRQRFGGDEFGASNKTDF